MFQPNGLPELALAVCAQAGIDPRCHPRDTTSFSRSGEYGPNRDEPAMTVTHGDSHDHRPDLQQAVLARMVVQDGGVPCVRKSWPGQTSDIHVGQERAQALMTAFAPTPSPRYRVAKAQRDHADNAPHLKTIGCITRIPTTRGGVARHGVSNSPAGVTACCG
jgi:hypothetical protein